MRAATEGIFGSGVFGNGYFGVASSPVPISATIVSNDLLSALSQDVENVQQINATVFIGGVNVSNFVESIIVQIGEKNLSATATIVMIGAFEYAAGASVYIDIKYSFPVGSTFTNTIIGGFVRSSQPSTGSSKSSTSVYCYDLLADKLQANKANSTFTGTAKELISSELTAAGITGFVLDFTDYTLPVGISLSSFTTAKQLIDAVSNGRYETVIFADSAGMLFIRDYDFADVPTRNITTKGMTFYQKHSNADDQYKTVTIQGIAGVVGSASGAGKSIFSGSNVFCETIGQCEAKAAAMVARSLLAEYSLQTPINPLIKIGHNLIAKDTAGTTLFSGRVTGVSHSVQWTGKTSPGAWSNITLRSN